MNLVKAFIVITAMIQEFIISRSGNETKNKCIVRIYRNFKQRSRKTKFITSIFIFLVIKRMGYIGVSFI